MYDSAQYPTTREETDAFVAGQRHGTLLACAPGAAPEASLLPFVRDGDVIEVHCVQADPTFAAARANPAVSFFVSDFLAFSPHDWIDPDHASQATLHFRAVLFRGRATTSTDPDDVAATLRRLLEHHEPGATYLPIVPSDDHYGSRIERLAAIRIDVESVQAKFKVGPARSADDRRTVVQRLRERDEAGDLRAADVIEARIDRG